MLLSRDSDHDPDSYEGKSELPTVGCSVQTSITAKFILTSPNLKFLDESAIRYIL